MNQSIDDSKAFLLTGNDRRMSEERGLGDGGMEGERFGGWEYTACVCSCVEKKERHYRYSW